MAFLLVSKIALKLLQIKAQFSTACFFSSLCRAGGTNMVILQNSLKISKKPKPKNHAQEATAFSGQVYFLIFI